MTVLFGDTRMPERFWSKLTVTARNCWEMPGEPEEYATFWLDGKVSGAHRIAWQRLVGPVAAGLDLDHGCRNKPCCNPAHLEPVTRQENIQRAFAPLPDIAQRTHCSAGHELTTDNVIPSRVPYKRCKTCHVDWITAKTVREIDEDDWTWYDDE